VGTSNPDAVAQLAMALVSPKLFEKRFIMSYRMRPWAATTRAVMALGLAPVAIVIIASPALSRADVCVNGQVLNNVGVCVDVVPPPPPEGTACVTATGRHGHVTGGVCN
jgi:hypothetical protein